MNRRIVEDLVRPFKLNDHVASGWVLTGARMSHDHAQIVYTLSRSPVRIVVEKRSDESRHYRQSSNFNIYYKSDDDRTLPPEQQALVSQMVDLIRSNDTQTVVTPDKWQEYTRWERAVDAKKPSSEGTDPCTLYLVPGHLADPLDLSVRALYVLRSSRFIFVEEGKVQNTRAILERYGIDADGKEILELPDDALGGRPLAKKLGQIADRGEDACLFGTDEGIPGFCDPGKALLEAAAGLDGRIRIKSVGGASALGTALMRAETKIEAFVFLGNLDEHRDCTPIFRPLDGMRSLKLPVVLFSTGAGCRAHWSELVDRCAHLKGTIALYCDLTEEQEAKIEVDISDAREFDPTRVLEDDQKIVAFLTE